uniref:Uncharacterized protein n=1 Tax=Romanomermis culicivorax TaxID=13658 RepID=A0A915HRP3_ROMCU
MDIESYSNFIFAEFLKKTKNSALFIESDLFNYIQFLGGIPRLMNDGSVKFVMELVADQITPHTCTKAVFLIKYKLTPRIKDQIKQIIQNSESRLNYCCVIITTPSVSDENFSIFSKMESDLLEWMGNKDFTAEVLSMPLFLASLSTDLFICPTYGSLYPNLDNVRKSFFHSDFDHLPPDCRENLESLVANLHNFLKSTNLSQEIYCVGPTSSILGQKLANLGHKRQAATNDTCSLILVDRNTDLISPVIGRKFSAFDHILASNDTLSGHFNEKCVKLDQAMDFPPFTLFDRIDNQEVCDFIQQLIEKSPEDCLIIGKEKILRILQHQSKKEFPSESSIKFSDDFSPIFPHLLALTKNDDNFNGDTVLSTLQCLEMMASLSWDGGCLTDFVQYSAENK